MKTITVQQLSSTVAVIIADEEKKAQLKHETFIGISQSDVLARLNERLGDDWLLKKDPPVQFTKEDINAVASNRFFRTTGGMLLMGWVILIGVLAMLTSTIPIIPPLVYYILNIIITISVFYIYMKKLSKIRKVLWQGIDGVDTGK